MTQAVIVKMYNINRAKKGKALMLGMGAMSLVNPEKSDKTSDSTED